MWLLHCCSKVLSSTMVVLQIKKISTAEQAVEIGFTYVAVPMLST